MKKIYVILILLISITSCNFKTPTEFSKEALVDSAFINLEGEKISFQNILNEQNKETLVIDIWASWCGDCIKGMPKLRDLQNAHPEVAYVFLSLDRSQEAWKRGIKKYNVQGAHYFMSSGKKSPFGNFVNIDWIPRYMVVNKNGTIKVFKAIEADDKDIVQNL